jgi:hypothetical protein
MANPKQLAMMVRVLDLYSRSFGVTSGLRRDDLAAEIVTLFDRGFRDEGSLLEALTNSEAAQDGGQPH